METNCVNKKYPVGIQSFREIREGGYVYVDKTMYVHRLMESGKYYFLSRPRRFGKSLLLSTIEAFFSGRRGLFRGLAIDSLATDWEPRPVLHLDLNTGEYNRHEDLLELLDHTLSKWEARYSLPRLAGSPSLRFGDIISGVHARTGRKVVVLIDEYDKPMLNAIDNAGPASFMTRFDSLLRGMPHIGRNEPGEVFFQNAAYLVFKMVGFHTRMEDHTSDGRIDLTLETPRFVYVFGFKTGSTAAAAMGQVRGKEYWRKFSASGKKIFLIGAVFNRTTRALDDIEIRQAE